MFVAPKKVYGLKSQHIESYSVCENFVAYSSKEEGLIVKHLEKGTVIFQKQRNGYSNISLTNNYLVYQKNNQIHVHGRHGSDILLSVSTISIPFQSSFCQNYSPWISDLSVFEDYLAYCIDFQNKVEVKVYHLKNKKEILYSTLEKYAHNDFQFDYMESPLIKIYKNKLLCTTGGAVAYFYEDLFSKHKWSKQKYQEFNLHGDILKLFLEEESLGFVTESENYEYEIEFIHHDLSQNHSMSSYVSRHSISFFPEFLNSIIKYENNFFFSNKNITERKQEETRIYKIVLQKNFTKLESHIVNNNIRFMSLNNSSLTTIGKNNISLFTILKKTDILLPLFKGSIENKFGKIHENIDMKRYIFEFLCPQNEYHLLPQSLHV